jgi:hypothetical protein
MYLFFTVTKESQPQQGMLAQPPQGMLALGKELQKQQSNDNAKVHNSIARNTTMPNRNIGTLERTNAVS